jgi:hypothetical protein
VQAEALRRKGDVGKRVEESSKVAAERIDANLATWQYAATGEAPAATAMYVTKLLQQIFWGKLLLAVDEWTPSSPLHAVHALETCGGALHGYFCSASSSHPPSLMVLVTTKFPFKCELQTPADLSSGKKYLPISLVPPIELAFKGCVQASTPSHRCWRLCKSHASWSISRRQAGVSSSSREAEESWVGEWMARYVAQATCPSRGLLQHSYSIAGVPPLKAFCMLTRGHTINKGCKPYAC